MSRSCPECKDVDPGDGKFCTACGAPLKFACPTCGSPIRSGRPFCGECGSDLRTLAEASRIRAPVATQTRPPAPRDAEGERKQLTVLFADVQGSMELQEDLDVEAGRRSSTASSTSSPTECAVSGAPSTSSPATGSWLSSALRWPRRITRVAPAMRRGTWPAPSVPAPSGCASSDGVDLHVRVGLNSGEVVVGRVGEDLRIDPTALGHTVGLAQRMEALAVPGSAYLTEHTARLVEGWFRLRDLGPMTVKGVRVPLGVFVLDGPAPPRSKGGRATSRLVGRASEMARLEEALNRAAEGRAQVIGIVGEPGVGKSRLCDEFAASAIARGITVRRTAGVSHGGEVPLLPILAFFRPYFGITEADSPAQARERVSDRLLALDPAFRDDLPLFFDFLEVPDPERPAPQLAAEVRMRQVFEVLRRVTARRSEREVLVLLWEDLHWFDPQSAAFLERVIEFLPGDANAGCDQLPPGVFGGVDAPLVLPATPPGPACRPGRWASCWTICSAATRPWPPSPGTWWNAPAATRSSSRRWCVRWSRTAPSRAMPVTTA